MTRTLRSLVALLAAIILIAAPGSTRHCWAQMMPEEVRTAAKPDTAPLPGTDEVVKALMNRGMEWESLQEVVGRHPDLPPAGVIWFQWYAQSNRASQARTALEQVVVDEPQDPEAYVFLGNITMQERRITEAETLFLKAQELLKTFDKSPRRKEILEPQTLSGLASVAEARGKWPEAQTQLEALVKLNPHDKSLVATAMQRLARAHFQQADASGALKSLRDAKAKDPMNVLSAEATLARFYEQFGAQCPQEKERDKWHNEAAKWMNMGLRKAPDDLPTLLAAAQWALETGQLADADKYATKALQLAEEAKNHATDADAAAAYARLLNAKILRGLVAFFRKDFQTAEKYFTDALLQSPGNFAATNNLALALCEQKGPDGKSDLAKLNLALELANAIYQAKPRDPQAAATLGRVLYKAGYKDRAEGALRVSAALGNLPADTAYYLAQVAYDRGDKESKELAQNLLEAALKTRSFSMRPESEALLEKIKAEKAPAAKRQVEAPGS